MIAVPAAIILTLTSAFSAEIPWNDEIEYSRTSVEEELRDVLRGVLRANGLSVVFQGNVNEKISGHFEEATPRQVFNQLVAQYGLSYSFDPSTATVSIEAPQGNFEADAAREFLALGNLSFGELQSVLKGFGLGARGLSYDRQTNLLSVSGSPERVQQISELVNTLMSNKDNYLADYTGAVGAEGAGETEDRARSTQQPIDVENARVKVIPLRFAQVGQTTKSVYGQDIVVPGIAETLEALLGYSAMQPADREAMRSFSASANGQASNDSMSLFNEGRVSIDARTNAVIVWGSPRYIAEIERLIDQLDVPQPMVLIEVVIARAEVGTAQDLGLALRSSAIRRGGDPYSGAVDTGTTGGMVDVGESEPFSTNGIDAITLLPLNTVSGATVASFVFRGSQGFLQAQLNALADDNRASVLSAPRLVTMDNTPARISRSQNIFVQVDTGSQSGEVGLEEVRTGLTLEITPSIVAARTAGEDALVRLNINAINSAPGPGAFGQIDVVAQEVQTNVMVPDGATYVVGGLFDDTRIEQQTGVPGLKGIKGLGRLFRTDFASNSLGETVFFITPRIVDQSVVADGDVAMQMSTAEYMSRQRERLRAEQTDLLGISKVSARNLETLEEDE